jgi:hypothetical protein
VSNAIHGKMEESYHRSDEKITHNKRGDRFGGRVAAEVVFCFSKNGLAFSYFELLVNL